MLSHICKMGSHNLFGVSTLQIRQFIWHVCTCPWVLQGPGPMRTVVLCDPCKNCKMKAHAHIFHSVDCNYELWWLINCEITQTYTYSNDKWWHMALKREVPDISGHHFKHVHSNQYILQGSCKLLHISGKSSLILLICLHFAIVYCSPWTLAYISGKSPCPCYIRIYNIYAYTYICTHVNTYIHKCIHTRDAHRNVFS